MPADLQELWLSCDGRLVVKTSVLRQQLVKYFGPFVIERRHGVTADVVIDRIIIQLIDDQSAIAWNASIVTVYQLVSMIVNLLRVDDMRLYTESVAYECGVVNALLSDNLRRIEHEFHRLNAMPDVTPPNDCLRHIALFLERPDGDVVRRQAEHYVTSAKGDRREKMLMAFAPFLEHDDAATRRCVCHALGMMRAGEYTVPLSFIGQNDTDADVAAAARHAIQAIQSPMKPVVRF